MIFETRCAGCDTPGAVLCTTCRFALLGRPPAEHDHGVIAALPFTGRVRSVVLGLKYRNRRAVARHLAGVLVNRLLELGAYHDLDVVTWAPTSTARRRGRGFDQGQIIARTVARQLGLPCRALLARTGPSVAQTGRGRADRLGAVQFTASPGVGPWRVLVVDDVVTTGATLRAAGEALRARGAEPVLAAVAATPDARGARVVAGRGSGATPGLRATAGGNPIAA